MNRTIKTLLRRLARHILADEIARQESGMAWLRHHADGLTTSLDEAEAELTRLRERTGRQDPTPTEAQYLQIVGEYPGITAPQAGVEHWRRHSIYAGTGREPPSYAGNYAAAPLRSLLLKGYVRREPTKGGTYRYWTTADGGAQGGRGGGVVSRHNHIDMTE